MEFCYVYILQSQAQPEHFYVGLTDDLHDRLRRHNGGAVTMAVKWHIRQDSVPGASRPPPASQTGDKLPPLSIT